MSSETDKVGGQAFVTEYAKPTSDLIQQLTDQPTPTPDAAAAKTALLGVLGKFPYITRLYARMSAEEMTDDPTFMVSSNTNDVDNVHDLSDPNETCNFTTPPPVDPCTFEYCGRRGVCVSATMAGANGEPSTTVPACSCASDAVARVTTTGANGTASTYCEPVAMNLDAAADAQGSLVQAACEGFDCGAHGACVPMNGNPACQCEGGYAATVGTVYDPNTGAPTNKVTCEPVPGPIPPLPNLPNIGSTVMPRAGSASSGGCDVTARGASGTFAGLLAALGMALASFRRRRR